MADGSGRGTKGKAGITNDDSMFSIEEGGDPYESNWEVHSSDDGGKTWYRYDTMNGDDEEANRLASGMLVGELYRFSQALEQAERLVTRHFWEKKSQMETR